MWSTGFYIFDIVIILVTIKVKVNQRSDDGEEMYEQIKQCIVIFEGWEEMAAEGQERDPLLVCIIKNFSLLDSNDHINREPWATRAWAQTSTIVHCININIKIL